MLTSRPSRWVPAGLVGCVAVAEVAFFASEGDTLATVVAAVVLLGLTWWVSPLRLRASTSHRIAYEHHTRDGAAVIFWRPGCVYCTRLRLRLGNERRRAIWVNVWTDDEASEFVRELNDGDETVPTVLIGDAVMTNPDSGVLRSRLRASDGSAS